MIKVNHQWRPQIHLDKLFILGQLSTGPTLVQVGFIPCACFIKSEDGYPIKVDAVFHHGADYISRDADGKRVRLDVCSLLNDKSGTAVRFNYTGIMEVTGPAGKLLGGAADAATTNFGDASTHVKLGSAALGFSELQYKVYVASGRFIVLESSPVVVKYKISEVAL